MTEWFHKVRRGEMVITSAGPIRLDRVGGVIGDVTPETAAVLNTLRGFEFRQDPEKAAAEKAAADAPQAEKAAADAPQAAPEASEAAARRFARR